MVGLQHWNEVKVDGLNFGEFPLKILHDKKRDEYNVFPDAKIIVASFAAHFDVLEKPVGCAYWFIFLTLSNKLPNHILFLYFTMFLLEILCIRTIRVSADIRTC